MSIVQCYFYGNLFILSDNIIAQQQKQGKYI